MGCFLVAVGFFSLLSVSPSSGALSWSVEFLDEAGRQSGPGGAFALDGQARPHIVFYDLDAGGLKYGWRTNRWYFELVGPSDGSVNGYDLALNTGGEARIAYRNADQMWVAWHNGTSWSHSLVDGDIGGGGGNNMGVAMDSLDRPHLVYQAGPAGAVELRYARRGVSGWIIEVIDAGSTLGSACDIGVDGADRPHVSYQDEGTPDRLRYARREATGWVLEDVYASGNVGEQALALDFSGQPHMSFLEGTTEDLMYARRDGPGWSIEPVDSSGRWGWESSLEVDGSGAPHISYWGAGSRDLRYARWNGSAWAVETVDSAGDVGRSSGISVDVWGRVHIAYEHTTVGTVAPKAKYALGVPSNPFPSSTVLDPSRYWWNAPVILNAAASDPNNMVEQVALYYRFLNGSSWQPWALFGTDGVAPWQWTFSWPDGQGHYEFYSVAFDGTDWELQSEVADISAGYDATPPVSSALPVFPYWHEASPLVVNATAIDALSGVANLVLWYASSPDNASWGPWTSAGSDLEEPWSWGFPFPEGEGHYRFITIAGDVAGNVEAMKAAAEAVAGYRTPDAPPAASAWATASVAVMGQPITFDASASTDDRGLVAYLWEFGDGTTSASVVTTHAYASRGARTVTLSVWDTAGQHDADTLTIQVKNRAPVADAGSDRSGEKNTIVTLDGTASSDPDADPLALAWTQILGPAVPLDGAETATPTFVPIVAAVYEFNLRVEDGWGGISHDTTYVTVPNQGPVAEAGDDATVRKRTLVTLHGEGSFDPDGDALTFTWTQALGPSVVLSNPDSATPAFTPPASGTYGFELLISDGDGGIARDTVRIFAKNTQPSADAGLDRTARKRAVVQLDGGASSDADGDFLGYRWTQVGGPSVPVRDAGSASATFVPITSGTYAFRLLVDDSDGGTSDDTVMVVIPNAPPIADAGADLSSRKAVAVVLDGSASTDPDGDAVSYAWTQTSGPEVTLTGVGSATPSLLPARSGAYEFRLTVQDAEGATAADDVSVLVWGLPPVAFLSASPSQTDVGQRIVFDATASDDPDGTIVVYAFDFGDGPARTGNQPVVDHAFAEAGTRTILLTVTDDDGNKSTDHVLLIIHPAAVRPADTNWKPVVAVYFATALALVGAWSAMRAPWSANKWRTLRAFTYTALPLVGLEAATGVLSHLTGLLAIPPLVGWGTAVDVGILVGGVGALAYRVRRRRLRGVAD